MTTTASSSSNSNSQLNNRSRRAHKYAQRQQPLLDPTEKALAHQDSVNNSSTSTITTTTTNPTTTTFIVPLASSSSAHHHQHPTDTTLNTNKKKEDLLMSPQPQEEMGMVRIPSDGDCEVADTSCAVGNNNNAPRKSLDIDDDDQDYDMMPTTTSTTPYWKSTQMVELVVCVAFYIATQIFFASFGVETFERPIPSQYLENSGDYILDASLNETNLGSTVSPTIVCIAALILQQGLALFNRRSSSFGSSLLYDNHATLCTYVTALAINRLVQEWVKNYVGYLRPIFYEKCEPDENYEYCTSDHDSGGRKSFPSGHASMSFCGLMLLTLYIHTRMGMGKEWKVMQQNRRLEQSRATSYWTVFKARLISLAGLLPLALAVYIAADRVRTNHHHPADIVGGALLGGSVSIFVHGLWFD